MKLLALALVALLAASASAASFSGRSSRGSFRRGNSRVSSKGARRGSFAQQASGGGAAGVKGAAAAEPTPGWLANPTPGALIRTAGMGFKISDGGGERLSIDYAAAAKDWGSTIVTNALYAQNATGAGMRVGPADKAPYPANSGSGSGAGGNGITTSGTVLGLDSSGNTTSTQGH